MFTEFDRTLYSTRCEVIETASHLFIYPIFKNGSTSLYRTAKENNWKIIFNRQIKKCDSITVFINEPKKRLISGLNTHIEHLFRDNKDLDQKTIEFFLQKHLFLDRHYLPQIFWLVNLAEWLDKTAILSLEPMSAVSKFTDYNVNVSNQYLINNNFIDKFLAKKELAFYLELDNFLYQNINKKFSWQELILNLKNTNYQAYDYVFNYAKNKVNAVP